MVSRLSVRLRCTLAAALAATVLFGAGALLLRHELYAARMRFAEESAPLLANAAVALLNGVDSQLSPAYNSMVAVDADGAVRMGMGDLFPYVPDVLGPVPAADLPAGRMVRRTVTFPRATRARPPFQQGYRGRTLTVYVTAVDAPASHYGPASRVTVYVDVAPWDAEATVASADRLLAAGLPAAVLLVALTAWVVTGRALRPVSAIRTRMADITSRNLHERVPVPASRDEIAALAVTTNATLERLEDSVERQRRFVADAAHELRSPLASLRADLEVALHYPQDCAWPDVAAGALADTERLQALADDLLLLASLDGSPGIPASPVPLADLARRQAARSQPRPGVAVTCDVRAEHVKASGDSRQLERLLRNLLDNAVRHARTRVTVIVDAPAVLEVADDGPGVPEADRDRVFERFARLDGARERDSGGAGLGLAIARGIARRHGGDLRSVEPQGCGARFVAELPAWSGPAPADPA